jgi:hypothetical protein
VWFVDHRHSRKDGNPGIVLDNERSGHGIGVFWIPTHVGMTGILSDSDAADELDQTPG